MNTPKTKEAIADEIQQHFFQKGATVSKSDYDLVLQALTLHEQAVQERVVGVVVENTPKHITRDYRDTDMMRDNILKALKDTALTKIKEGV